LNTTKDIRRSPENVGVSKGQYPVPSTISPELAVAVGAAPNPHWAHVPPDTPAWRALQQMFLQNGPHPVITTLKQALGVTVEAATIGGTPVFISTPHNIPPANRNRILLHIHGGSYVLFPGEFGAGEGVMMAGYGGFKVVSVDFRMPPDHPFPAPLDDIMTVYKELLTVLDPGCMAIFGTSSGGAMTLAAILRAKIEGLPLPGAIAPGSPIADLLWLSDTLITNAHTDNMMVCLDGWLRASTELYLGGVRADHPFASPLYGDFTDFPPTILTAGTRDLMLSDTVRVHRKLRQAGVTAVLQVFEAQSHGQFLTPFAPETTEAFGEIARFFDAHLGR
jgi:monoterpene epsilon-lactone hydrolase